MQAIGKPLYAFLILSLICEKTVYAKITEVSVDPGNIAVKCKGLLENFAAASSAFTQCAVCYARPIKLCERCIDYYLAVLQTHIAIEVEDSEGHKCKTELINLDRLEVIEGAFKYVTTLWEKGECDDCFVMSSNGTLTSELSNITLRFQNLYRSTNECISNHYNQSSQAYDKDVCFNCTGIYHELNVFYDEIKTNTDGKMCIDIVDMMNSTRSKWSKKLGCGKPTHKVDIAFLASMFLIATTPIVFYSVAKQFSDKGSRRLLRQTRLARTLSSHVAAESS